MSTDFQPAANPSIVQAQSVRAPGRAHVLVIGNEKGGSGKSTTAMHIVVALLGDGAHGGHDRSRCAPGHARPLHRESRRLCPAQGRRPADADAMPRCRCRLGRSVAEADEKARFEAALEPAVTQADFVVDRHAGQRHAPVAPGAYLGRHAADAAQRQLHRPRPAGPGRSRHAQDRAAVDLCRGGVEAASDPRRCRAPAGRLDRDAQPPVVARGAQQARHGQR